MTDTPTPTPTPSDSAASAGDYVLVPKELTEAMLLAHYAGTGQPLARRAIEHERARAIWRTLLAAAPVPPRARVSREMVEDQLATRHALTIMRLRAALHDAMGELVIACSFSGRGQPDQGVAPYPSLSKRMFAASERARAALSVPSPENRNADIKRRLREASEAVKEIDKAARVPPERQHLRFGPGPSADELDEPLAPSPEAGGELRLADKLIDQNQTLSRQLKKTEAGLARISGERDDALAVLRRIAAFPATKTSASGSSWSVGYAFSCVQGLARNAISPLPDSGKPSATQEKKP